MIGKVENYSVLMSVYNKEKPEYLKESMNSIYNQTMPTDDFVLVCDGQLNDGLNEVIIDMQVKFGNRLFVHRLDRNGGLGNALNIGIKYCKNELVARMDSDDISRNDRCEKEFKVLKENPDIDIVSGTVEEFTVSISNITGIRELPGTIVDIVDFSKKRNPFNHPSVMFKKSKVIEAGGYNEKFHLFEDYYLWVRMFKNGCKGLNLAVPLLYMRSPTNMYLRRGGRDYARNLLRFHKWMLKTGWTNHMDYWTGAIPHAVICILPNKIRRLVYKYLHA